MDVVPNGGAVRASWSEDVRVKGRRIYVSTAVERTVAPGEGLPAAMSALNLAITYAHASNIEEALKGLED